MKIDLHTHTQNLKSGDGPARVISPEDYVKKMSEQNISICSITNHNKFDIDEYEFINATSADILVFPGIEIDIDLDGERRQIIVICNPGIANTFKDIYDDDPARNYNAFSMSYTDFLSKTRSLNVDDIIIIPHFLDKARGLTIEEKQRLTADLEEYVIILETANLTSMGIVNDHEAHLCLIGSDVKDWSQYSSDMVPDLKFNISSFEKFHELAKDPKGFVKNFLNGSPKHDVALWGSSGSIVIYDDINVIFGEKGSGKTVLLKESIYPYFSDEGKQVFLHEGSNYEKLYNKMLAEYESEVVIDEGLMQSIVNDLNFTIGYRELHPQNFIQGYILRAKDTNDNKKAKRIAKANTSFSNTYSQSIERVLLWTKESIKKIDEVSSLNEAIRNKESESRYILDSELSKLKIEILEKATEQSKAIFIFQGTESFLTVLKESVHKNSGKKSNPTNMGLAKLIANRLMRIQSNKNLVTALNDIRSTRTREIGSLPGKGAVTYETSVVCLSVDDRHGKDSAFEKSRIRVNREIINKISKFTLSEFASINSYFSSDEKTLDIPALASDIVRKNSVVKIKGDDNYKPSDGEKAILSISGLLESYSYDCYLFDEIERGLGHKYITDYLIPRLKTLRDAGKTIVLSTHDANIAVNTLPSQTILCNHPNKDTYYTGNMYSNELIGTASGSTINWNDKAIIHLEGGNRMFNSRKNVYEG